MNFRKLSFFILYFLVMCLKFQHDKRRKLTKYNEWFHATKYSRLRVTAIWNCKQPGTNIFRPSYHCSSKYDLISFGAETEAGHSHHTTEAYQYLTNGRPTWCHLLFYFTYYVLNMFRTLIYPSSGACDCADELPHRSSCSQFVLQPAKRTPPKTSLTKSPTHNELRTRRPMW